MLFKVNVCLPSMHIRDGFEDCDDGSDEGNQIPTDVFYFNLKLNRKTKVP